LEGRGGRRRFFSDQGFFFTGRGGGFKSRLCLRFGGKEGGGKHFFLGPRIFLQGKGKGAFLGLRKNKGVKRKKRIKGEKNKNVYL
jgi:hypothetical protein